MLAFVFIVSIAMRLISYLWSLFVFMTFLDKHLVSYYTIVIRTIDSSLTVYAFTYYGVWGNVVGSFLLLLMPVAMTGFLEYAVVFQVEHS
uniref:Uncharacterized protein n=1 Tax=Leersia perrieri TaxID=77586 RepID=A0A0D9XPB2_9ORYZ